MVGNIKFRGEKSIPTILKPLYLSSSKLTRLTRISHKLAAATPDASVLTAFYSVGLLDVLPQYVCGCLPLMPCQNGASTVR